MMFKRYTINLFQVFLYFFSVLYLFLLLWGTRVTKATEVEALKEDFRHTFAKASCDFALDLIKAASNGTEKNLLVSPSSVSVLLAILQQGALDNTATQLEKILRLSAEESRQGYGQVISSLKEEKTNVTLEWGSRAFVAPGFDLNENFLNTIEDNFNATFEELNLKASSAEEAATKINDWVKEVTHGNIQNLLDPSLLGPDVIMVLVNAIFFKSIWESPFQKYKTRSDKFKVSSDSKVEVPFMRQAGRFLAGEDTEKGIKWVELPFKDDNYSMIFILPMKEYGLGQAVEKLSGADLKHIFSSEAKRRVKLVIPKFKLTEKISLSDTLKEMGLTDIFSNEANLQGISTGEERLRVSEVVHQAEVEIDEEGSTASAATFDIVQTLSLELFSDELYFKADHPFLFFIVDKSNNVPLFAGQMVDPSGTALD